MGDLFIEDDIIDFFVITESESDELYVSRLPVLSESELALLRISLPSLLLVSSSSLVPLYGKRIGSIILGPPLISGKFFFFSVRVVADEFELRSSAATFMSSISVLLI